MNCEVFVLLEELGFVSEARNCVCSGQLVGRRVECAWCLENSPESLLPFEALSQRLLSFVLHYQQLPGWYQALEKEEVPVGRGMRRELRGAWEILLPGWPQSIDFQTEANALGQVRTWGRRKSQFLKLIGIRELFYRT